MLSNYSQFTMTLKAAHSITVHPFYNNRKFYIWSPQIVNIWLHLWQARTTRHGAWVGQTPIPLCYGFFGRWFSSFSLHPSQAQYAGLGWPCCRLVEFGTKTVLWMCADELQAQCGPAAGEENHQVAVRPHQHLPLWRGNCGDSSDNLI